MENGEKNELYRELLAELESVLAGIEDSITAMATFAAVVYRKLPDATWAGFYRVVSPRLLRVGPYQGPLGCIEIPFDRGVCGAAARERSVKLVPDVHAFPGHIACDAQARSELVVPVFGPAGDLVAVFDLDSHAPEAFDEIDRDGMLRAVEILRRHLGENARASNL